MARRAFWTGLAAVVVVAAGTAGAGETEDRLLAITGELLQAIATGDRAVWDRNLAADAIMLGREGTVTARADLVASIEPKPPGIALSFAMLEPRVLLRGDAAVVTYVADERLVYHGQDVSTRYRSTYHYVKENGAWRVLTFMYLEIPADPPRLPASAIREALAGEYELVPGIVTTVVRQGDRLVARRPGRDPQDLVPHAADRFHTPGKEGETFFESDPSGRVTAMVARRNGKDLRWRRVQPVP